MEMSSTHYVIMEQCHRHQGKANVPILGLKQHQLQILQLTLLSHETEPDMTEASVILQVLTASTVLTNQKGHLLL